MASGRVVCVAAPVGRPHRCVRSGWRREGFVEDSFHEAAALASSWSAGDILDFRGTGKGMGPKALGGL
jgi:hypothetical protein